MYGHEIEKDGKGFKIGLFKRRYFLRQKLAEVALGLESEDDAKKLCSMLDESFKAGLFFGKEKRNDKM